MEKLTWESGDVITKLIQKSSLKIAAVARIIGVNRATLYNWMQSATLEPIKILRIEAATGINIMDVSPAAEEWFRKNGFREKKSLEDDELTVAKVYNLMEKNLSTVEENRELYRRVSVLEGYLSRHGIDTVTGQKHEKTKND